MDRSGHPHAPATLPPRKDSSLPIKQGLFVQQLPSGRFALQINFFSMSGFEPQEPSYYTRKYRILTLKYNKCSNFKGAARHLACEILLLFKITAQFLFGKSKRVRVSKQSFWTAIKGYGIVAVWLPVFNYSESLHAQIIAKLITGFYYFSLIT